MVGRLPRQRIETRTVILLHSEPPHPALRATFSRKREKGENGGIGSYSFARKEQGERGGESRGNKPRHPGESRGPLSRTTGEVLLRSRACRQRQPSLLALNPQHRSLSLIQGVPAFAGMTILREREKLTNYCCQMTGNQSSQRSLSQDLLCMPDLQGGNLLFQFLLLELMGSDVCLLHGLLECRP